MVLIKDIFEWIEDILKWIMEMLYLKIYPDFENYLGHMYPLSLGSK